MTAGRGVSLQVYGSAMQPRTAPHWTAPHWTAPQGDDADIADITKAVTALQKQVDKLFEKDGGITAAELTALSKKFAALNDDFEKHAAAARKSLAG